MGSCLSLHKTLEPTVKPRWWFAPKTANSTSSTVLIQTHIKVQEKDDILNHHLYSTTPKFLSEGNATSFHDSTNIDDSFFDSHACFESDCEDFFSVNGDFTPSRGSTPVRQNSFAEVQPYTNAHVDRSPDLTAQPSPIDSQKRLAEFLHKSFSDKLPSVVDQVRGTARASVVDSVDPIEATPSRLPRSVSRCLPSLPRSLSFGERKKRSPQTIGQ